LPGRGFPDGARQHSAHDRLRAENMLNARPDLGSALMGLVGPLRQPPLGRAVGLNMAVVALRFQLGFPLPGAINRVGPHVGAGVGLIEERVEDLAVVNGRLSDIKVAYQLVLPVDADVVRVAEEGLALLLRAGRIGVINLGGEDLRSLLLAR